MTMAKRKAESLDAFSPSEIKEASPKAKVQCVVTALSEMKKSRDISYFDGQVSDGKKAMRVYGYNDGVRRKLSFYKDNKASVTIDNCQVTKSRVSYASFCVKKQDAAFFPLWGLHLAPS